MKISIEINTVEYENTEARDEDIQTIRGILGILEGEVINTSAEVAPQTFGAPPTREEAKPIKVEDVKVTFRGEELPQLSEEQATVQPSADLSKEDIIRLQSDYLDKFHAIAKASKDAAKELAKSLQHRYGTTNSTQFPPHDLPDLIDEAEKILDQEQGR